MCGDGAALTRADEEHAARRLLHIKEITERIVEDLGGDPDLILRDRIHAGNAEGQLEKIGEAAKALSEELRLRQRHGRSMETPRSSLPRLPGRPSLSFPKKRPALRRAARPKSCANVTASEGRSIRAALAPVRARPDSPAGFALSALEGSASTLVL